MERPITQDLFHWVVVNAEAEPRKQGYNGRYIWAHNYNHDSKKLANAYDAQTEAETQELKDLCSKFMISTADFNQLKDKRIQHLGGDTEKNWGSVDIEYTFDSNISFFIIKCMEIILEEKAVEDWENQTAPLIGDKDSMDY